MDDRTDVAASIDRHRVAQRLSESLLPVGLSEGVRAAKPDVFLGHILEEAIEGVDAETLAEFADEFGIWGLVEQVFPRKRVEVACAVSSSMVSGTWGMDSIDLEGRGYFIEDPDSDSVGELPYRLLGAWEPFDDENSYRSSFVETYVRLWQDIGLPPYRGEHARGPIDLMVDAVMRIGGPGAIFDAWEPGTFARFGEVQSDELAQRAHVAVADIRDALALLARGSVDTGSLADDGRGRAFLAITLDVLDSSPFDPEARYGIGRRF